MQQRPNAVVVAAIVVAGLCAVVVAIASPATSAAFGPRDPAQAFASLPSHVRLWLNVINVTCLIGIGFVRMREAQVIVPTFLVSMPVNIWVLRRFGIDHPLAGVGHVIFWLPAATFVLARVLRHWPQDYEGIYRRMGAGWAIAVAILLLASSAVDFWNVLRYLVLSGPVTRV